VFLALVAIALGKFDVLQSIAAVSPALVVVVSVLCVSVIGGGLILFRKLTRLKFKMAAKVAAIYVVRSCVICRSGALPSLEMLWRLGLSF